MVFYRRPALVLSLEPAVWAVEAMPVSFQPARRVFLLDYGSQGERMEMLMMMVLVMVMLMVMLMAVNCKLNINIFLIRYPNVGLFGRGGFRGGRGGFRGGRRFFF